MNKKEESYSGESKKGKRHGFGRCDETDGSWYAGEWKNDHKHGLGMESSEGGISFLGMYSEGKYNGYGTMYPAPGNKEQILTSGEWNNGVLTGLGLFLNKNGGPSYAGQIKEYRASGAGFWYHANGSVKGTVLNEKDGSAVTLEIYPDGTHCLAHWQDDVYHGDRIEWGPDGTRSVYKYTNGELLDPVMVYYTNGTIMVCEMIDGMFHGDMYFYPTDGSKILKHFAMGKQIGDVTVTHPDGIVDKINIKTAKKRGI